MNFLSLTFRDLQYLVALAEHKNFGKAAKACFVSQPALSAQIKKIEGYFDKKLFDRYKKEAFLTSDGELVVEKAREILQNAQGFDDVFEQVHQENFKIPLSIGMIHTIAPYFPNAFIPNFLKEYPQGQLELIEGYTEELISQLKLGKIDVLIASEVLHDAKLDIYPLFQDPLLLIINKHHAYALKERILLTDLNPDEMIFLKEGNCLRNEAIDLCPKNKRGNIRESYLSNLETLKHAVGVSCRYAIIPKIALSQRELNLNRHSESVVIKSIDDSKAYRQISLFMRKQSVRQKELIKFYQFLISHQQK